MISKCTCCSLSSVISSNSPKYHDEVYFMLSSVVTVSSLISDRKRNLDHIERKLR